MNDKPDEFADTGHDQANKRIDNAPADFLTPIDRRKIDKRRLQMTSKTVVESRPAPEQGSHHLDDKNRTVPFEDGPRSKHAPSTFEFCMPIRIGRFEIIECLGVGGHGIVYRASDPGVGREVAIKVPRTELLSSREQLIRFAREANIVGLLEHQNIVPIYECDWYGDVPYIVMPYIRGKTLRKWRAGEPTVAPRMAAEIVRQLAEAVQHAHERGVLHRDLKTGNVLLASNENDTTCDALGFTPKLTDFGSAKCERVEASMTRTGAMVGTIVYMSPEQIEGRIRDITAQTDVYGLGVILYETLTGQPPFRSDSVPETLDKIVKDDPAPFEFSRVDIPFDLKVICLKCLEKKPANRYPSANALANDLQKFLNGEPISARPVSTMTRIAKSCRRHPIRSASAALVVVSFLTLTGLSLYYNALLAEQLDKTKSAMQMSRRQETRAIESEEKSRKRAYVSDMRNAKLSWDRGDVRHMLKLLNRHEPKNGQSDIRNFAWWYLWREYHESSQILGTHDSGATATAITRAGDLAASGGGDGLIKLWSLSSGKMRELHGHGPGPVNSLVFSPTGRQLVSAGEDGTLRIWDVSGGQELMVRREHQSEVVCVEYSPQGNLIASGGMDGTVRLWNSETFEPVAILSGHTKKIRALAFHPSEPMLVSGSLDGTIRFWNMEEDGTNAKFSVRDTRDLSLSSLKITGCYPRAIAIEPHGESLIVATTGREVVQISLAKQNFGDVIQNTVEAHQPYTLAWPHSDYWLTGLGNAQIRVADARTSEQSQTSLKGHTDAVLSIALSADASRLVSASRDGVVRYWPHYLDRNQIRGTIAEGDAVLEKSDLVHIQWHGRYLAVDDLDNLRVHIFRMPERQRQWTITHGRSGAFQLSPGGKYHVMAEPNGMAICRRVEDGTIVWETRFADATWQAHSFAPVIIDPSDQWIGIINQKELIIMSLSNAKVVHRLEHPQAIDGIVFLKRTHAPPAIISIDFNRDLRIWDVPSGRLLKESSTGPQTTNSLAISNDQRLLASMSSSRIVRIWELDGITEEASISTQNEVTGYLAFVAAGSKILAYSNQGITLWDIEEEAELIGFPEFLNAKGQFAVSPDGNQLAIYLNGTIHLLDGRSPDQVQNQIWKPQQSVPAPSPR